MSTIKNFQLKDAKKIGLLDLELLIGSCIQKPREFVLAHPEYEIPGSKIKNLKLKIARRRRGEPLAHILGQKEFFGLDFKVNKHTLVPRPETELLVEEILKLQPKNKTIIDVGTGSGNIIISLAKNLDARNRFIATDISNEALKVAKRNAKAHQLSRRISFFKGNLLQPILTKKIKMENAVIAANLPYLDRSWKNLLTSAETKGLKFEPDTALYAGEDGLDAYRQLAGQIKKSGIKNSLLFCEIGHLQAAKMKKIFSFAQNVEILKDLAGKQRVCKISL